MTMETAAMLLTKALNLSNRCRSEANTGIAYRFYKSQSTTENLQLHMHYGITRLSFVLQTQI